MEERGRFNRSVFTLRGGCSYGREWVVAATEDEKARREEAALVVWVKSGGVGSKLKGGGVRPKWGQPRCAAWKAGRQAGRHGCRGL